MLVGALVPFHDAGGDPDTVREYAQALEAAGYDFLEAPDHVLGATSFWCKWAGGRGWPIWRSAVVAAAK
jgi:alkanesulfonate monooxygenase SsuD/methylene tetrahydromethanopterin reductase-like flavin-dependent oxidoreductase (luciferase family)